MAQVMISNNTEATSKENTMPDSTSDIATPLDLSSNGPPQVSTFRECVLEQQTGAVKRKYDHVFKIVMVGESGVGKTSLACRFVKDIFDPNVKPTLSIDFKVRVITTKNKIIKVQLWDTAGCDSMRNILPNYFRCANAIILVCDYTDSNSIRQLPSWYKIAQTYSETRCLICIMVTKCDLPLTREDNPDLYEDVRRFTETENLHIFTTSARNGSGVESSFMSVIRMLEVMESPNINGSKSKLVLPPSGEESPTHHPGCCGICYPTRDIPVAVQSASSASNIRGQRSEEPPVITIPRRHLPGLKKLPSVIIPPREDENRDDDDEDEKIDLERCPSNFSQKYSSSSTSLESSEEISHYYYNASDKNQFESRKRSPIDDISNYPIAKARGGAVISASDATKYSRLSLPGWMRSGNESSFQEAPTNEKSLLTKTPTPLNSDLSG